MWARGTLRLGVRAWFEWIDSRSNIADGLSRQGLSDPLLAFYHVQLSVAQDLPVECFGQQSLSWVLDQFSTSGCAFKPPAL